MPYDPPPTRFQKYAAFALAVVIGAVVLALAFMMATTGHAQTFPERGRSAVVDAAGVIPDAEERALDERITKWVGSAGPQLAVVTVPSLEGYDVKDYSNRLFRAWGLGDRVRNDGVLLLLAPAERKVRIEVGYGLEPVLTDGLTGQIIRDRIVPGLKAGVPGTALSDGAEALMEAATPAQHVATRAEPARGSWWPWLIGGFAVCAGGVAWWTWRGARRRAAEEALFEAERRRREKLAALGQAYGMGDIAAGRTVGEYPPRDYAAERARRTEQARPKIEPTPGYHPQPETKRKSRDDSYSSSAASFSAGYASSSSSDYSSSSSSSSSDSSSSSGYDSGGGSSGGGGSDSSY